LHEGHVEHTLQQRVPEAEQAYHDARSNALSDEDKDDIALLVQNLKTLPLHEPPRSSGFKKDRVVSYRPSMSREIFRAFIRLFIGILIAVGATLAWQAYSDEAKGLVGTLAPAAAWLLPVSTLKSPADGHEPAHDAALSQSAPITQNPPALLSSDSVRQLEPITRDIAALRSSLEKVAVKQEQIAQAVPSSDSVRQLEPITRDLAAMRSSLEQLAVKQEQMAQNLATLHALVEQDIKEKMSPPPPSEAVPLPQRKPPHAAR
jgi:hypothetical protein